MMRIVDPVRIAVLLSMLCIGTAVARAQSAVDGFDPGANGPVYALAMESDGQIIVGGEFTGLGGGTGTVARANLGRLNADGSVGSLFNPGADGPVRAVAVQPDGKIVVGGSFTFIAGASRNNIARLNANGSIDPDFNPGASSTVWVIALQSDGKILVGGSFWMLGGGGSGHSFRNYIGRLNADGSLDTAFNPGPNSWVRSIVLQPDGRILVAGDFTSLRGDGTGPTLRSRIARLYADGSLDPAFNPGANDTVYAVAIQRDRRILVGGSFTALGGVGGTTLRSRLGRLTPSGAVDSSFDPGTNNLVRTITVQRDGKIVVGGLFSRLGGGGNGTSTRHKLGRLNGDGSLDTIFDPHAGYTVWDVAIQPDGKILAAGEFTTLGNETRNGLGRLYSDGSLDTIFDPGANNTVYAMSLQRDGMVVVAGVFTQMGGGGTGATVRNRLARLKPDGTLDEGFNPGANSQVNALGIEADGKIVVGGQFGGLGGGTGTMPRNYLGRLNPDGSVDGSFDPGATSTVAALAIDDYGRILVGGFFTGLGGRTGTTMRQYLGRLHSDGSVDLSFDPGANGAVTTMAVQADGKILVAGGFTMLGGRTGTTERNGLGRLNADGTVDSFNPSPDGSVYTLAVQEDGKILVGGDFSTIAGGMRSKIARLNADGSLDADFDPGADGTVSSLAVQTNGKILVGGSFTTLGGGEAGTHLRSRIGRLHADGTIDASFDPGASSFVAVLTVQPDGKILVGGLFHALGGGASGTEPRRNIGRLTNTGPAGESVNVNAAGSIIVWERAGPGPEVARVVFESSIDGAPYTLLGTASRFSGGWRLTGRTIPRNRRISIRATGHLPAEDSSSLIESVRSVYLADAFADDPLHAGLTTVRAVHLTELRQRINALRGRYALGAATWTDTLLTGVEAKAVHILELRTALQQAYLAAGEPVPSFLDPLLVPGSSAVRAAHLQELRDNVFALEAR